MIFPSCRSHPSCFILSFRVFREPTVFWTRKAGAGCSTRTGSTRGSSATPEKTSGAPWRALDGTAWSRKGLPEQRTLPPLLPLLLLLEERHVLVESRDLARNKFSYLTATSYTSSIISGVTRVRERTWDAVIVLGPTQVCFLPTSVQYGASVTRRTMRAEAAAAALAS